MTTQIYNAELARLLAPSAPITQPTLQDIINYGAVSLDGLIDVIITYPPQVGQYLRYSTYEPTYNYWTNVFSTYIADDLSGVFQPYDNTLTELAAYNSNGLITQTAADTFVGRTIVGPAAGITVSNGNGVAGNPTLALANDLLGVEGLGTTGIPVRTAADTWTTRTITENSGIDVAFGDGIAANPKITQNDLISPFLAIPGLVGFWPMSSWQRSTGNVYDISGQGRTLTPSDLTLMSFGYSGLIPYVDITPTSPNSGHFYRADETDLDVIGTETHILAADRGLTVGGWVMVDDFSNLNGAVISKGITTGNQRSFSLFFTSTGASTGTATFIVDNTGAGTTTDSVIAGATVNAGTWYFVVGRFDPSTEVAIFLNGAKNTDTTTIIASIFNSTGQLSVGRQYGDDGLDGKLSLVFMSSMFLSDSIVNGLFEQTRHIFGV